MTTAAIARLSVVVVLSCSIAGGCAFGESGETAAALELDEPAAVHHLFWISPTGNDANDCRSKATACRRWSRLLAVAEPLFGKEHVDLMFACGPDGGVAHYTTAANGPFGARIGTTQRRLSGTAAAKVIIRGEQPRCAVLDGDGAPVMSLQYVQHVIVSGLIFAQQNRCFGSSKCSNDSSTSCGIHADCGAGNSCLCELDVDNDDDKLEPIDGKAAPPRSGFGTLEFRQSDHVAVNDCEFRRNNRYYNSMPLFIARSDNTRIQYNRVYGSHRHLMTVVNGNKRCGGVSSGALCGDGGCVGTTCATVPADGKVHHVVTGNYMNACAQNKTGAQDCQLWASDLEKGFRSHSGYAGDECISIYFTNDARVVNNIMENCEGIGSNAGYGGGDKNVYANNVILKPSHGMTTWANTDTGDPDLTRDASNTAEGTVFYNNVVVGERDHGALLRDGSGTRAERNTIVRDNWSVPGQTPRANAIAGFRITQSLNVTLTPPCAAPRTSVTLTANFVTGTSADPKWRWPAGYSADNHVCDVAGTDNAFCDYPGACGSGAIHQLVGGGPPGLWSWTQPRRPAVAALPQYVYIPAGDPRATAANGERVGADIRCIFDNLGNRTTDPLWSGETALFDDDPQGVVSQRILKGHPAPACPPLP